MKKRPFSYSEIMAFDQKYRAIFINSLGGFKSVCLIGTKSNTGLSNLAIFSSIVHIGANPPLLGFIVRPDSAERHTLENILETSYFTLNHVNQAILNNAHQTSARYPRQVSEFNASKLTEEYNEDFFAPFVKESFVQMGIQYREKIDLKVNGTTMVIGEIKQVIIPESCLAPDGFIDLELAGTLTCSGLDSYHSTTKISRLTYAKPDTWPTELK
ncbi:MAG: flavin reductase [Opitutaceae bacterium]|nr:flavin reductase [Cytophagales bacterium]